MSPQGLSIKLNRTCWNLDPRVGGGCRKAVARDREPNLQSRPRLRAEVDVLPGHFLPPRP